MELLSQLCKIQGTAGNEAAISEFLLTYIRQNLSQWKVRPTIHHNSILQDSFILEFGRPRTAVFAHMDTVGYTVGYYDQLIPIGSPQAQTGDVLVGNDTMGPIECTLLIADDSTVSYQFPRAITRGTDLVFKCDFRENEESIESCHLDNRLGVYNMLNLAEELTDGLLVFSCREEHGGGSMPVLAKYIYETFGVSQALISDITWITDGIAGGNGVVISLRDQGIPRKAYLDRILELAESSGTLYQLEVESSGSSDARELQASPYPFDWCFIGAPESGVHSPNEKVYLADVQAMIALYKYLMQHL